MEVFSVSTYYKQVHRLAIIVAAAACPTGMCICCLNGTLTMFSFLLGVLL